MMAGREVSLGETKIKVERTGTRRFRTVRFEVGGREYQAIEQNPGSRAGGGNWHAKGNAWCRFAMWSRGSMSRRW
jgi:hypothetical protein